MFVTASWIPSHHTSIAGRKFACPGIWEFHLLQSLLKFDWSLRALLHVDRKLPVQAKQGQVQREDLVLEARRHPERKSLLVYSVQNVSISNYDMSLEKFL